MVSTRDCGYMPVEPTWWLRLCIPTRRSCLIWYSRPHLQRDCPDSPANQRGRQKSSGHGRWLCTKGSVWFLIRSCISHATIAEARDGATLSSHALKFLTRTEQLIAITSFASFGTLTLFVDSIACGSSTFNCSSLSAVSRASVASVKLDAR